MTDTRKTITTVMPGTKLAIRLLRRDDLEAIVAIDQAVTGRSRRAFFTKRLDHYARDPTAFVALAADIDGRLAGFAFARLYEGEFGGRRMEAALDAIGVEAASRHRGIGRELVDGLAAAMRIHGVTELSTQAEWAETDLIGFFANSKFALAPRVVLERPTDIPLSV